MNQAQRSQLDADIEKALAASRAAFAPWLPKGDDDEAKLRALAKSRGLVVKAKSVQPSFWTALSERIRKSRITAPMSDFWRGLKSSMTGGK